MFLCACRLIHATGPVMSTIFPTELTTWITLEIPLIFFLRRECNHKVRNFYPSCCMGYETLFQIFLSTSTRKSILLSFRPSVFTYLIYWDSICIFICKIFVWIRGVHHFNWFFFSECIVLFINMIFKNTLY